MKNRNFLVKKGRKYTINFKAKRMLKQLGRAIDILIIVLNKSLSKC